MAPLKIVSREAFALIEQLGLDPTSVDPGGYTAVDDRGTDVRYDWSGDPDEDGLIPFLVRAGDTNLLPISMGPSDMERLYGTLGAWVLIQRGEDTTAVEGFLAEMDLTIVGLHATGYPDGYYFEPYSYESPYFDWSVSVGEGQDFVNFEVGDGDKYIVTTLHIDEFPAFFAAVGAWVHNHRAGVR